MPRSVPAGTGEVMQYLVRDYNDNTIRFLLHYPAHLDPAALCAAAKAVVESAEVLHGSFLPGKRKAFWQIREDYEVDDYFSFLPVSEDPLPAGLEFVLHPLLPSAKTQFSCRLVQGREDSVLAVLISHLCVDGGDGLYLLSKLCEGYELYRRNGHCSGLTVKNGTRAAEQVYAHLSPAQIRSLMHNPLSPVKSTFPFPSAASGRANMVLQTIPAVAMTAAAQNARTFGASVNDVLLTACYRAYAALDAVDASGPMSILSMMDLRRHCPGGASAGLANLSGSLPTTLSHGIEGDFSHTLGVIADQTRTLKADPLAGLEGLPLIHGCSRRLPLRVLLKIAKGVYGSMSLGLTNLGRADGLSMGGLSPDSGWFGGPMKKKPGMQVSAISLNGSCGLSIAGEYTPEDAAALQQYLSAVRQEVETFAASL